MNSIRRRCQICGHIPLDNTNIEQKACEKFLFNFLVDLSEKLDDPKRIDEHFTRSIFNDETTINRISCNGLTLMHINILGGQSPSIDNESERENNYLPGYDEYTAIRICQILLKRGGSVHGNHIYEMRPLHIAIRQQWLNLSEILLEEGANPNIPERDIYASRPLDVAVINDDIQSIKLLQIYGADLHGQKSLFHLRPLAEAFVRGYFNSFLVLLELGAPIHLELDRNTLRSFGTDIFLTGNKGRRQFINLLYEHGGDIESEFRLHPIRYEPDGVNRLEPEIKFSWDPDCIADLDSTYFIKWICQVRSLKEICRLSIRRHCFRLSTDGYQRLLSLKSHSLLNLQLYNFIHFKKHNNRS